MKTSYRPGIHRFAVFVFFWTILLLVAGALVTSNEAALSVPDWPTSYGSFTPPMVVYQRTAHRREHFAPPTRLRHDHGDTNQGP